MLEQHMIECHERIYTVMGVFWKYTFNRRIHSLLISTDFLFSALEYLNDI